MKDTEPTIVNFKYYLNPTIFIAKKNQTQRTYKNMASFSSGHPDPSTILPFSQSSSMPGLALFPCVLFALLPFASAMPATITLAARATAAPITSATASTTTVASGNVIVTSQNCVTACPATDTQGYALTESSFSGNTAFCRWNWPGGSHFVSVIVVPL
jgi:hypothetical protein